MFVVFDVKFQCHWSFFIHQLLAVLLPCAGTEQLHVEESEDSQQLRLQVVCLEYKKKEKKRSKESVRQESPKFVTFL